ncbi:F14D2.9-like protein [Daphnia magna]|uniref:F14D2.9-like protein n=1 Tax=Daphnia magna TaxID=35525 RepID=A0A162C977_9CRUS|nr:F14D2.9-like protein [Daphnia magna]
METDIKNINFFLQDFCDLTETSDIFSLDSDKLTAHLLPKRKTKAKRNLLPLEMVLISLKFYATGTFQTVVGNVFRYSYYRL